MKLNLQKEKRKIKEYVVKNKFKGYNIIRDKYEDNMISRLMSLLISSIEN